MIFIGKIYSDLFSFKNLFFELENFHKGMSHNVHMLKYEDDYNE